MSTTIDSKPRTDEFARLFYLFEHLASRGKPAAVGSNSEETPSIPEGFAPVLKNLAAVLATRTHATEQKVVGRPRRNTVAASTATGSVLSEESESVATFPLAEKFPFTFKLMIHKLYDMEEWADKVKEVLEASQMQFKPLAETEKEALVKKSDEEMLNAGWVSGKREGAPMVRARSRSIIHAGKGKGIIASGPRSPTQPGNSSDLRALKKRCVGRRKSTSGMVAERPGTGSVWIYDAAVSSVDIDIPHRALNDAAVHRKSKSGCLPRSRHQSLARLEGAGARDAARQRVQFGVIDENVAREVRAGNEGLPNDGKEGMAKRKAMMHTGVEEPRRMKKRPLST